MKHPQTSAESHIKVSHLLNRQASPNPFKTAKPVPNQMFLPNRCSREIAQAIELKKSSRLHEALKKIDELIEDYPTFMRCYQLKGEIAFSLKQFQDSLACYNKLLQMSESTENPDQFNSSSVNKKTDRIGENYKQRSLYYYNQGLCLQKLERHAQAINSFKNALSTNKNNINFYVSLAQSYYRNGEIEKTIKIFQKLTDKSTFNPDTLKRIIIFLNQNKEFEAVIRFIQKAFTQHLQILQKSQHRFALLSAKADSLRKLQKYQLSIEAYLKIIQFCQQQPRIINTLFNLAFCYQKCANYAKSIQCYKRILAISSDNIEAINNIANLEIRLENFHEALSILNSGIVTCSLTTNHNNIKLLLLKSHRIVAFMKLGRVEDSEKDLREIINAIKGWQCLEMEHTSQWENYKFIKGVVSKYSNTFDQLSEIYKEASVAEVPVRYSSQLKQISKKLMNSISCQLQSKTIDPNDELEKLSQRISKLYKEIIDFKSTTLKQQEISQLRVHHKIQQIQQILQKKQEQTNKLVTDMQELKRQYLDVYNLLKEIHANDKDGVLPTTIKQLRSSGKQLIAIYIQQLYWVFSAYIISIRLVANHLVSQGKDLVHMNKISTFFSRFKSVFETASRIPHIGAVCAAINSLLSLYLNQQSNYIYHTLNRIITRTFTNESHLHKCLQKAVHDIAKTDYIEKTLEKCKRDKIRSEMTLYNRAQEWFRKQKCKAIKKIMQLNDVVDTPQELLIKEQIIEDIGSILLFLIRNKDCHHVGESEFFSIAFNKALLQNFKGQQITSLYQKHQQRQVEMNRSREGGCSNKCQIY